MITKDTHKIDWNKNAHIAGIFIVTLTQVAGIVVMSLAKAVWWFAKKSWPFLRATIKVLGTLFVALLTAWAFAASAIEEEEEDSHQFKAIDENGCDLSTGLPVKNRF